ncbi:flagellar filament capping protein FliD [Desulfohalovibrio reitneri]|uniref:flagellar filament capping protein FliD n=1 Tax=Desulfohalovibrio reitneri TaxID=1307759 RepID=UPI0004A6F121|nr:flagellar filament capping protein FliD [Desulfohalovibrio reitneri]
MVNSELESGAIRFTGLGSGTDFDSIVEKLVQIEGIQKRRFEHWKETWELKQEGFNELETQLFSLKSTLEGFDRPGEFLTKDAESTNPDALTATAGADAEDGTYTFSVNQLAQTQIVTMDTAESDLTDQVNSTGSNATFAYNYQGTEFQVDVPDGTTLSGLVNAINNDPDNPGVRASTIKVSDTEYHLQIRGLDTGADNTLVVSSNSNLTGYTAADDTITQQAQDAELRINGYPSNAWITRSTNSVDDVVEGLNLLLKDVTGSNASINVSVETDRASIEENIRTFVDSVNEVRQMIIDLTDFDELKEQGSLLTGNYGVEMISKNLKDIVASKGVGFDYSDDTYSALSQIGILTEADEGSSQAGLLTIDQEALDEALNNDLEAVASIFSAYYDGKTDSSDFIFASSLEGTTEPGTYDVSYEVDAGGNVINATIGGVAANYDASNQQLTAQSGDPRGLSVQVNNLTQGTYSGEVRLKVGKTTQMVDELKQLTNSQEGTLSILEDNYQNIIDNIDRKIENEERRLEQYQRRMKNRFARLEATLQNYNGIQQSLQSQMSQLSGQS